MAVGAADNQSGPRVVTRAAPTPAKKPTEKPEPKAGVLSDDACGTFRGKNQVKLNRAVNDIRKAYTALKNDPEHKHDRLIKTLTDQINNLSSKSKLNPDLDPDLGLKNPVSVWNAGACIASRFQGNAPINGDIRIVESRSMANFRTPLSNLIKEKGIINNEAMQAFANDNPEVRAYIDVQARILLQSETAFSNFVQGVKMEHEMSMEGMAPALFNAVVFRCTELAGDESTQWSIVKTIKGEMPRPNRDADKNIARLYAPERVPPFRGNIELQNWAYARHGVLPEPHDTLIPWPK